MGQLPDFSPLGYLVAGLVLLSWLVSGIIGFCYGAGMIGLAGVVAYSVFVGAILYKIVKVVNGK